jgi:hypothetical protein
VGAELAQAPSTAYDIARYDRARLVNMRRSTDLHRVGSSTAARA